MGEGKGFLAKSVESIFGLADTLSSFGVPLVLLVPFQIA
jgi:hypothetical protein